MARKTKKAQTAPMTHVQTDDTRHAIMTGDVATLQTALMPHDAPDVVYVPLPPLRDEEGRFVEPEREWQGYLIPPEQRGQTTGRTGVKDPRSRGVVCMGHSIVSFWTFSQGRPVMVGKWEDDEHFVFPVPLDAEHDDVKALWALLSTYPIDDHVPLWHGNPRRDEQQRHYRRVAIAFLLSGGWTQRPMAPLNSQNYWDEMLPDDCRGQDEAWEREAKEINHRDGDKCKIALSVLRGHPHTHNVRYDDGPARKAMRDVRHAVDEKHRKASQGNVHVDYVGWMREDNYQRTLSTTVSKYLTAKGHAVVKALCDRKAGHVGCLPKHRGAVKTGLRLTWMRSQLEKGPSDEEFMVIRDRLIDDGLCQTAVLVFHERFVRLTVSG